MDDEGLLDELQEDLGPDYSPQLRVAAGMLSGDAQAAVPYLLFSIAKSLEDISFLLANDSVSVADGNRPRTSSQGTGHQA